MQNNKMVAHLRLRANELRYEEIGGIITEIYRPERKPGVAKG